METKRHTYLQISAGIFPAAVLLPVVNPDIFQCEVLARDFGARRLAKINRTVELRRRDEGMRPACRSRIPALGRVRAAGA
jgi:hypothetical protein